MSVLLPGMVVKVTAGNEKSGLFMIVTAENNFAFLANGKKRKLESPKKKNIRHINIIGREIDPDPPLTDKRLRRELRLIREQIEANT